MEGIVVFFVIMILVLVGGVFGWGIAKDQECYAVCKRENELRKEYADIFKALGYKGIDGHPDLTQCVCR